MIIDELIPYLRNAAMASEAIAALASFVFLKNYHNSWLRWMPLFLTYVFLNDTLGGQLIGVKWNNLIYNIYSIIAFTFYLFVYYRYLRTLKFKRIILACVLLYLASVAVNMLFQNIVEVSLLYAYALGGCCIILAVLFYFIEKLSSPNILRVRSDLLFWISVGLLLFYVGYIPIKVTRFFFSTLEDLYLPLIFVHLLLVIIMNSAFILGFIWSREK